MYDVSDTAPFVSGPFGDLLGHHATWPQTVAWAEPNTWTAGTEHVTPDLTSLVQAFIDRPDYAPGNHIGFVITEGTIAAGRYYGWEDFAAGGVAPTLTIEYVEPSPRTDSDSLVMESDIYRVTVSTRGAITSLIDKTRGDREFARSIGGYYLNDLGPSTGSLTVEEAGPVSVTVCATAALPVAHVTRVTMYRDSDRIEISNEIAENFDSVQQWRFGFELEAPDVWHEEVGAIIRAKLAGSGGRYAESGARYDWLTLNHFADMTGVGNMGVTLSNADCYFMRLSNSSAGLLDTTTPQISILAGGRVVSSGHGIPAQGGDDHFTQRFAIRTHDQYDQPAAMRLSLEHQNPFVAGSIRGTNPQLDGATYSAMTVSDPDVLFGALKPAEEGIEE
ncbi:MAG: hypothetical protein KJ749_04320, partial [Planctomycetes bacterium]|nr:hypothetical protein [Planctomycetota bacterium]